MTKQQQVQDAVARWAELGLPDPEVNKLVFVRALIAAGILDEGQAERSAARMVRMALGSPVEELPEPPPAPAGVVQRGMRAPRYTVDDAWYYFYPRNQPTFAVSRAHIEDMKRAYANKPNGLGMTINQICTHWKIGRREFVFMLNELGWTHDQDEFTREEHLELNTHQLLADREQRSRWQLEQQAKDAELVELRRLAATGVDFEQRTEALRLAVSNYTPPAPGRKPDAAPVDRLVVLPLSDLHLGAPGTEEVEAAIFAFLEQLPTIGAQVLPVWNGDLFHVDTPKFSTTRGTPQDAITYEPYELLERVYATALGVMHVLAAEAYELLPTIVVAGNHDEMACYHWKLALRAAGYAVDDQAGEALKVTRWNDELLCFEHGDGGRGKVENHLLAVLNRHRALVGATKRTWMFTGHLHHAKQLDVGGAVHHQLTSPEHSSRWARKNAFEGQRALQAFEYEATRGLTNVHWRLL